MCGEGLRCLYTNLDTFNNKRAEIEARIAELRPDIIGLTEVKPKNATWELANHDISLEGYTLYSNLEGRGSALYVNEKLGSAEVKMSVDVESTVWCKIPLKDRDSLLVGVVYRSPNASEQQNGQLNKTIGDVMCEGYSHVLIMGDFNYPEINWEMQVSTASAGHSSQEFLTSLHDSYLHQHVTEPTHHRAQQRANILDLVMTNESGMIHNLRYGEPIGKSHHSVLDWTFRCYQPQPATKVKKYLYDKGNFLEIREMLGGFDWANILCGKSADEMWVTIRTAIGRS